MSLDAIEAELAQATPFADFDYLSRHTLAEYARLLSLVAPRLPAAATLSTAVGGPRDGAHLLHDPLVRRSIEDAVLSFECGLDAIDSEAATEVFLGAAARAESGDPSLIDATARCLRLRAAPGPAFVWADDRPDTVAGRRFRGEVLKRLPGFVIAVPSPEQVQLLEDGLDLALRLTPDLARSALSHLRMVVLGDFESGGPINALTVPGLSGVVFLSPHSVTDPAAVAESLVHESIHLKFLDIEYVHALFPIGFRPASSPRITPAWHRDEENFVGWPLDRVLTSMQVYVSLAVFFGLAAERGVDHFYDRDDCRARSERSATRAAWLFGAVQDHLDQLSPAGREFVAWMGDLLAALRA